ncbi:MAG: signal peptidase I [Candidatus Aminicenantes bacterium]|nr:signal peptidase I [Candidatus Aminicenantes bacterium]
MKKEVLPKVPKTRLGAFVENLEMILEVLVLVFFVNAFLVQAFAIPTPSMENEMLVGDHILVDRVAFSTSLGKIDGLILPQVRIERGMKVAFKSPPEIAARNISRLFYVKRIIGLPGETIKLIANQVYIDGRPIDEPYKNLSAPVSVSPDFPPASPDAWPPEFPPEYRSSLVETPLGTAFKIPVGHFFCMGDNRNLSADSRIWGPLPADDIVGRPWRNYWSTKTTTADMLGKSAPARLKDFLLGLFTKTRWNRILKRF